jgi:hypothetical protein
MDEKRRMELKNLLTGAVIFACEAVSTLDLLQQAVKAGANLYGANLYGADLRGADLRGANLYGADLRGANLRGANLRGANLRGANLYGANLYGANLYGADLRGANTENVKWPAPSVVLLVNWADLSPQLTADLMFLDASNHPEPSKFDVWAKGGDCPYRATNVERMAWFYEKNELWGQGRQDTILNLMNRILSEKCPKWTDEQTASFEAKFKK